FSSRRRHTRSKRDWSSDVCSSDLCQYKGIAVFCGPRNLRGESDLFYRNNGNGTFTEATQPAGLSDTSRYYGFAVLFEDLNGDGRSEERRVGKEWRGRVAAEDEKEE